MNDTLSYNLFGVEIKPEWRQAVVAIGNFDGVHRGHQALLQRARAIADQDGHPLVVLTFGPHPRRFLQPEIEPFLISQPSAKDALLQEHGVDAVITLPFTERFSRVSAADFMQDVLRDGLAARHIVVGEKFVFGQGRQGHVDTLRHNGFAVTAISPVHHENGTLYSSTAVRLALQTGDLAQATANLGRKWSIRSKVVKGQQLGRTIGFPTANFTWPADIVHPLHGIYAVTCVLPDNSVRKGAGYYGKRPTVMYFATAPLLEVHLFDFEGTLHGQELTVTFDRFIRPDQKFETLEELKARIAIDCEMILSGND